MNAPAARPEEDAEILELHRAGNKDGLLPIAERLIWAQFWKSVYANVVTPEQREEMVRSALVEVLALLRREEGKNPWDPAKGSLATLIYQPVLGAFAETAVSTALIPRGKADASQGSAGPDDDSDTPSDPLEQLTYEDAEKKFEIWREALRYETAERDTDKLAPQFTQLLLEVWLRGLPELRRGGEPMPAAVAESCPGLVKAMSRREDGIGPRSAENSVKVGCLVLEGRTLPEIARALGRSSSAVDRDWKAARAYLQELPGYMLDAIGEIREHFAETTDDRYRREDQQTSGVDDDSDTSDPSNQWGQSPKLKPSR